MTSEQKTVSTRAAIGSGQYGFLELRVTSGTVYLDTGNEAHKIPLPLGQIFPLHTAKNLPVDISLYYLSGSGSVTIFYYDNGWVDGAESQDAHDPEGAWTSSLDKLFEDKWLTDTVTYLTTSIRASIQDEVILIDNDQGQVEKTERTAEFKLSDLPAGWKLGDTITFNSVTYYTIETYERDTETIKFILSTNARTI